MYDLKNTTALVKSILEADVDSRNSDSRLYLNVLRAVGKEKGVELSCVSITYFLTGLVGDVFPPFESVRRARQKLQRRYPELAAKDTVRDYRAENEAAYEEYARSAV